MARGVQITQGVKLDVYSTKISVAFKHLLGAQVKALGDKAGHRELLEEMHKVYVEKYPERASRALEILGVLNPESVASAQGYMVSNATPAEVVTEATEAEPQRLVQTVRYVGRPQLHLYEPGRKNNTGCALAGTIDPDSISDQSPDAVDCKKCRYCRKAVFA
ncbi:hypothetical protein [Paenibacillus agilis]|uniref:Uncharacterized protein n=1 Tax=Paenibacillus agilis TaxID=3020863 RepID=A0A559IX86_9BACL|nr:hypothetical protein [Paenibacillus agilis]TVX92245.1 hypothetical protein FPZ44_03720 [Paenibacillus agilis]